MFTSDDGSLILSANVLHNTKHFTSHKVEQPEQEKKRKWKHPQGTVISVNEVLHHIFKNPEVITNLNFVMMQNVLLETRTGKWLQNLENPTKTYFTQSDANVTNNPGKIVRIPNELR